MECIFLKNYFIILLPVSLKVIIFTFIFPVFFISKLTSYLQIVVYSLHL